MKNADPQTTVKPVFEPLRPLIRNNAFTAVQAAMVAIVTNNPDAARGCLEIALDAIVAWRGSAESHG